jgi:hypothetical protein
VVAAATAAAAAATTVEVEAAQLRSECERLRVQLHATRSELSARPLHPKTPEPLWITDAPVQRAVSPTRAAAPPPLDGSRPKVAAAAVSAGSPEMPATIVSAELLAWLRQELTSAQEREAACHAVLSQREEELERLKRVSLLSRRESQDAEAAQAEALIAAERQISSLRLEVTRNRLQSSAEAVVPLHTAPAIVQEWSDALPGGEIFHHSVPSRRNASTRKTSDKWKTLVMQALWRAIHHRRMLFSCETYDLASFFRAVDKNRDNSVSKKELRRALQRLDVHVTPPQLTELLQSMDTDHSGGVDLTEFTRWMAQGKPSSSPRPVSHAGGANRSPPRRSGHDSILNNEQLVVHQLETLRETVTQQSGAIKRMRQLWPSLHGWRQLVCMRRERRGLEQVRMERAAVMFGNGRKAGAWKVWRSAVVDSLRAETAEAAMAAAKEATASAQLEVQAMRLRSATRIVQRLQLAAAVAAFNRWQEYTRECSWFSIVCNRLIGRMRHTLLSHVLARWADYQRVCASVRKTLHKMMTYSLSLVFRRWLQFVDQQRTRRRVVSKMHERLRPWSLAAALGRWNEYVSKRVHFRRVVTKLVKRFDKAAKFHVFESWVAHCEDSQQQRRMETRRQDVMRRAIARMQATALLSALATWLSVVENSYAEQRQQRNQSLMLRVLRRMQVTTVASAWRHWLGMVALQRQSRESAENLEAQRARFEQTELEMTRARTELEQELAQVRDELGQCDDALQEAHAAAKAAVLNMIETSEATANEVQRTRDLAARQLHLREKEMAAELASMAEKLRRAEASMHGHLQRSSSQQESMMLEHGTAVRGLERGQVGLRDALEKARGHACRRQRTSLLRDCLRDWVLLLDRSRQARTARYNAAAHRRRTAQRTAFVLWARQARQSLCDELQWTKEQLASLEEEAGAVGTALNDVTRALERERAQAAVTRQIHQAQLHRVREHERRKHQRRQEAAVADRSVEH